MDLKRVKKVNSVWQIPHLTTFLCQNPHVASNVISFLAGSDFTTFYFANPRHKKLVEMTAPYNRAYLNFKKKVSQIASINDFIIYNMAYDKYLCRETAISKWKISSQDLKKLHFVTYSGPCGDTIKLYKEVDVLTHMLHCGCPKCKL